MQGKLTSLSIIIPAYNDEKTIETVIRDAGKVGKEVAERHEIVVLNDASPDNTQEALNTLKERIPNLRIYTHEVNKGYGQTIKELYYHARYEWLFSVPGDNQIPVSEVKKLIELSDQADMIVGLRANRNDPLMRLFQSWTYNILLKIFYGIGISDINSVRLMKTSMLKKIKFDTSSAFVDAELVIDAIRHNYKVIETPIDHKARQDKRRGGGGSLRTILPVIQDMLKYLIIHN